MTNRLNVVIVIPIYKEDLTSIEKTSFCQTLRILGHYDISIMTYRALNTAKITALAEQFGVTLKYQYFDQSYFKNVQTYSHLLMTAAYYKAYAAYDYMLICQTDAYVFRDDLPLWCAKGYDYVGAPWFGWENGGWTDTLSTVGNGGFCLRKIQTFIKMFHSRHPMLSFRKVWQKEGWVKACCKAFGYHNNFSFYVRLCLSTERPEDEFYCKTLRGTHCELSMPTPQEALQFSFENKPSQTFELNNRQLPFGCHAFSKNEYDLFWSKYISVEP